jgi:predicted acyl esterase
MRTGMGPMERGRAPRARVTVAMMALLGGLLSLDVQPARSAQSELEEPRSFDVAPRSEPLYAIRGPRDAGAIDAQQRYVDVGGRRIFVETWLPSASGGNVPPGRIPTIVVASPYAAEKAGGIVSPSTRDAMVPRGYAYAQVHVTGTGSSDGCIDMIGPTEAADSVAAIRWLDEDAPWTNGHVGGFGQSYDGGAIIAAAVHGAPLDAVIAGQPAVSGYETLHNVDGVGTPPASLELLGYYAALSAEPSLISTNDASDAPAAPFRLPGRAGCHPPALAAAADQSYSVTQWHREREHRLMIDRLRIPVFTAHGHADLNDGNGNFVLPSQQSGFFDRIHPSVKKVGVFGVFGHELPSAYVYPEIRPAEWQRPDFDMMRIVWWDHWLKGIDGDVDEWPTVQVQGTDGQWRAESDWPTTGGPPGQLALSADGVLGAAAPAGTSTYVEGPPETPRGFAPGTSLVFRTARLADRLEITGQPVLDLWAVLDRDDAHVAARLETFDADDKPIRSGLTFGMRSAQHLDPIAEGIFLQSESRSAQPERPGQPTRIAIRFQPTDLVVPAGGWMQLTLAGSILTNPAPFRRATSADRTPDAVIAELARMSPMFPTPPSASSGAATTVKILHDCRSKASVLRFEMPHANREILHVPSHDDEDDSVITYESRAVPATGGLADSRVCGAKPQRPGDAVSKTVIQADRTSPRPRAARRAGSARRDQGSGA